MKKYRVSDLGDIQEGHILKNILPGEYINKGGLSFEEPGSRTHTNDGPDGKDGDEGEKGDYPGQPGEAGDRGDYGGQHGKSGDVVFD